MQPKAPCKPGVKARLPDPTRRHLLREDLENINRLLVVYNQCVALEEIGRSEADRLKFVSEAKHALRCGENPPAMFAANLRHQRWQYDQADEDTAWRQLNAHLYGIDPQRRAQPPPSELPALSEDARFVDLVLRVLPPEWRDRPFLWIKMRCPEWTRERWENAVRERAQYQLACQQVNALRRLGELGTLGDGWGLPSPETAEPCPECRQEGCTGGCLDVDDDA
jgi:hypothetical protein